MVISTEFPLKKVSFVLGLLFYRRKSKTPYFSFFSFFFLFMLS
nr:MAG TPA: hypothetical protein [Crassvirales sp.]